MQKMSVESIAETRSMAVSGRRVVIVSINRGPSDPRAMYKEARSLAGLGYDVTYICNDASGPMATADGVRIDAVKMPASRLARQMYGPDMMLRETLRFQPDVIHVLDPALIEPALRLKQCRELKVVVDLPEDSAKQILQKSYLGPMAVRKLVSHAYQRTVERLLPQSDLVIVATPSIAASLPVGCRHVVVRNFPVVADIDAVSASELDFSESDTQILRVAYVGGMSPIRGIRELVVAAGMLQGAVELHLAGPIFDSRFLDELKSMPAWQIAKHASAARYQAHAFFFNCMNPHEAQARSFWKILDNILCTVPVPIATMAVMWTCRCNHRYTISSCSKCLANVVVPSSTGSVGRHCVVVEDKQ